MARTSLELPPQEDHDSTPAGEKYRYHVPPAYEAVIDACVADLPIGAQFEQGINLAKAWNDGYLGAMQAGIDFKEHGALHELHDEPREDD